MRFIMTLGGDKRTVDMTEFTEHADGSATVKFDFTEQEITALFRQGVIKALTDGIINAVAYDPEKTTKFNNKTIDLSWDQLEQIVVGELQEAYRNNLNSNFYDEKLDDAIKVLLNYYMAPSEYQEWVNDND